MPVLFDFTQKDNVNDLASDVPNANCCKFCPSILCSICVPSLASKEASAVATSTFNELAKPDGASVSCVIV